jgi:hypothetical protein
MGSNLVSDVYIEIFNVISSCLISLQHIFIVKESQVAKYG